MDYPYKSFIIKIEPLVGLLHYDCFMYELVYPNGVSVPEPTIFKTRDNAYKHAAKRVDELLEGIK